MALRLSAIVLLVAGCTSSSPPTLGPIDEQTVAVNETLRVQVLVSGALGTSLEWTMEAPTVGDLRALLAPNATGAEFRWSPLASEVGDHAITFHVSGDGGDDSETMLVHVIPPPEGAPVFLRPGAGATFDLLRDPCIAVPVEVKDDDSLSVEIREVDPRIEGSELTPEGDKLATWRWCPTPEQISVSDRYTLHLEAVDESHDPTPHTFVIVLRGSNKPDCPGAPPTVTITAPENGARLATVRDYEVLVTVSDDGEIRERPLLYYSLDQPDDETAPDLTAFTQIQFAGEGGSYAAYVPNLGLPVGEQAQVWLLASATDNDDPEGSACDHTTDTLVRSMMVATPDQPDVAGYCEACSADEQCAADGLCVIGAGGRGFCGAPCGGGCAQGLCRLVTSRGGVVDDQCVPEGLDCSGGAVGECTDDTFEDNDGRLTASNVGFDVYTDLQVCPNDDDYYLIPVQGQSLIDVIIDGFSSAEGDLDLFLFNPAGGIVKVSASEADEEEVSVCVNEPGDYVVRVAGFDGSANRYDMLIDAQGAACCTDDVQEDNDSREAARSLVGGAFEDGQVCQGDDDWFTIRLTSADVATIDLLFDGAEGDLDLELYEPDGTLVDSSTSADDDEQIVYDSNETGDYTIRVFGYSGAEAAYILSTSTESQSDCFTDDDCGAGRRCTDDYTCVDAGCSGVDECADGEICPFPGPDDSIRVCAGTCEVNGDCDDGEACKGFAEGRACGATGAGTNGAPCDTFADCSGQRACLDVPGGYCAEIGCATSFDCPQGSYCIPGAGGGPNLCLKDCFSGAEACRLAEGHSCDNVVDTRDNQRSVCVP